MRKGYQTTIHILDFVRTGKFGVVQVGQTYQHIAKVFPKPDDVFKTAKATYIWRYGCFEFHFVDGILTLLWCDNLDFMYSPNKKQFKLDRWLIGKYKNGFTLSSFIKKLSEEGIGFRMLGTYLSSDPTDSLPDNVILEIDNTTSIVYFENIDDSATNFYDYKLIAIGASQTKQTYKTRLL